MADDYDEYEEDREEINDQHVAEAVGTYEAEGSPEQEEGDEKQQTI